MPESMRGHAFHWGRDNPVSQSTQRRLLWTVSLVLLLGAMAAFMSATSPGDHEQVVDAKPVVLRTQLPDSRTALAASISGMAEPLAASNRLPTVRESDCAATLAAENADLRGEVGRLRERLARSETKVVTLEAMLAGETRDAEWLGVLDAEFPGVFFGRPDSKRVRIEVLWALDQLAMNLGSEDPSDVWRVATNGKVQKLIEAAQDVYEDKRHLPIIETRSVQDGDRWVQQYSLSYVEIVNGERIVTSRVDNLRADDLRVSEVESMQSAIDSRSYANLQDILGITFVEDER